MAVKNTFADLHNIMMEAVERLNEAEDVNEIGTEVARTKAMSSLCMTMVQNGKLMLKANEQMQEGQLKDGMFKLEDK